MKDKIHVLALLLSVLLLPVLLPALGVFVGENYGHTAATRREPILPAIVPDSRFSIWADPETGCEYILYRERYFVPRLSTDGSPKGCREIEAMKLEVVQ